MEQPNLFNPSAIPADEQVRILEKQLETKCQTYYITFGIFKSKKGPIDHNAMVVLKSNKGHNYNVSISAETMPEMFLKVNEYIKTL